MTTIKRSKITLPIVLCVCLFLANIAFAENITFVKEYTYQASDIDSRVSCRAISLVLVKRALLEQLGTYLVSETEVKNYQLTKDQVTTLTAGIVSAEIIDEKWDGRSYYLKAKITTDPKEVAKSVNAMRKDKENSRELEESKRRTIEAMDEVARLKNLLEPAKESDKKQDDYSRAIQKLGAEDWFERGMVLQKAGDLDGAVEAYTNAINLAPQNAWAYAIRGIANTLNVNFQQAINDFDKTFELEPTSPGTCLIYAYRGMAYGFAGNYKQAFRDFDKAIICNDREDITFSYRANVHYFMGNYKQAIKDYGKAIKLNPENAHSYNRRAEAYYSLGNHQQAVRDYEMAIKLDPKEAEYYSGRGLFYHNAGNITKAFKDFDRAIELKPKNGEYYYIRGNAYYREKNFKLVHCLLSSC